MSDRLAERFAHDTYVLRRKLLTFLGQKFHIYDPDGNIVLFAKLKAFKLREDIRLYTNDTQDVEVLAIRTQSIFDFGGTYDIVDSMSGDVLGALRRRGVRSMFRDNWLVLDAEGEEVGKVHEDSMLKAFARRNIPYAGALFRQGYSFELGGEEVATMTRGWNPIIERTTLDLSPDTQHRLDPRLALAATVLLAAVEGRQQG